MRLKKEITGGNLQPQLTVLVHDTWSDGAFQMCEVLSKYLVRFSIYRVDTTCDRNYDSEITGKICEPQLWLLLHETFSDGALQMCDFGWLYLGFTPLKLLRSCHGSQ